jgi:hypothetical protein
VEYVLIAVILVAIAWFVGAPLRRAAREIGASGDEEDPRRADLEARKEALYRQIRDAELDREQGKLTTEDWRRQDTELRREAIEVLRELDRLGG